MNGDPYLDMVARVATDAANGAAERAVSPVFEISSRAARASEHSAQLAGAALDEVRALRRETARRERQRDAESKQISADIADLTVAVVRLDARTRAADEAQDRAIFEARQRADDARRAAIEAREQAEATTGQFTVPTELRARQQSDAQIVHRVSELGLSVVEKGADVVLEKRRGINRANVRLYLEAGLVVISLAFLAANLFLKGCHQ